MTATILIALDGSALAEQALPYAEHLAQAMPARLVLCRILPAFPFEPSEAADASGENARAYLRTIADAMVRKGCLADIRIHWGNPVDGILEEARSTQASLVVMGTHGRSGPGRWLYGSVADAVLRRSSVPVIMVGQSMAVAWPSGHPLRILVPVDGSELAESALGAADDLAVRLHAELILLCVVPFPPYALYADGSVYEASFDPQAALVRATDYLDGLAARLSSSRVRVLAELGQPAAEIVDIARREQADLIAMATHGRSGLARLMLGSVANETLRRTHVPLLLVRPTVLPVELVAGGAARQSSG